MRSQLYIPLPCNAARRQMLSIHLGELKCDLSEDDFAKIVAQTEEFSGSDLRHLVRFPREEGLLTHPAGSSRSNLAAAGSSFQTPT